MIAARAVSTMSPRLRSNREDCRRRQSGRLIGYAPIWNLRSDQATARSSPPTLGPNGSERPWGFKPVSDLPRGLPRERPATRPSTRRLTVCGGR